MVGRLGASVDGSPDGGRQDGGGLEVAGLGGHRAVPVVAVLHRLVAWKEHDASNLLQT